ncbi:MAG: energy transducer TonB, partial [Bacteroidota bacterium]|nr:energy transducer TonB [Bacteroidota bacterium]
KYTRVSLGSAPHEKEPVYMIEEWHPNGLLAARKFTHYGRADSTWQTWNSTGQLTGEINYKKDELQQEPKEERSNTGSPSTIAVYPGGEAAMQRFMSENVVYPRRAIENGIEGTVMIRATIGRDGKVIHAEAIKGLPHGCSEEALRVVKMMPYWLPAQLNGEAVESQVDIPVRFKLN